jgi:hypothetical protein
LSAWMVELLSAQSALLACADAGDHSSLCRPHHGATLG